MDGRGKKKLVREFDELGPSLPGWAGSATIRRFGMFLGQPEAHLERQTAAKAARKMFCLAAWTSLLLLERQRQSIIQRGLPLSALRVAA
jgi:hypothetical protein